MLNRDQLKKALRVGNNTLDRLLQRGAIKPDLIVGKRKFYDVNKLAEFRLAAKTTKKP